MRERIRGSILQIRVVYFFTTIFLVAISFYAYFQLVHLIDSSHMVSHTSKVTESLQRIAKSLIDAGSNHKTYLLVGDSALLAKRDRDFQTIVDELDVVDSLTQDNKLQNKNVKYLRKLVNKKFLNFISMSQTYQSVQISPAFKSSLTTGFHQTENLIEEINKMSAVEYQLLEKRTKHFDRLAYTTPVLNVLLSIGALLILFISYFRLDKALYVSNQLKLKLEESNLELQNKNENLIKGGERYLKIFDNNPIAMSFAEVDTNQVIYANSLFYQSFGFTKEEVIGRSTEELGIISAEENERLISIIMNSLQEERPLEELKVLPVEERAALLLKLKEKMFENGFEILYTKKNGDNFLATVNFEVFDIGNKKFMLASYQDISEIKKMTKQLEEKNITLEKINKELESINYISSHDLQEPLRQIQIFTTRIREMEDKNLSPDGHIYFEKMNNAAKRMQNLIADLLTYSRTKTEIPKFKNTNINQIIDQVIEELAEIILQKNAIIEVAELGDAIVIPFQFRQMMYNLIGNSLKFSKPDENPHIKIVSAIVDSNQVAGAEHKKGMQFHHFTISDNGIGFEPQYKERIFEVFQRLHSKNKIAGTGIGLAIVKNIIENHNGYITATGELNKGATFDIYLPIDQTN